MIGLGITAFTAASTLNKNGMEMYQDKVIPISALGKIGKYAENTRVNMVSAVLNNDPSFTEQAERNLKEIQETIQIIEGSNLTTNEQIVFEQFQSSWNQFSSIVENNISFIRSNKYEEAREGLKKGGVPFSEASKLILELMEINENLASNLMVENQRSFHMTQLLLLIVIITAIALSIVIAIVGANAIVRPIQMLVEHMEKVTNGDLTMNELTVKNKDEIGKLVKQFNEMVSGLRRIITVIVRTSEEVAATSQEMAASTEQVTTASSEVSNSTHQVAKDAESGSQSVLETSQALLELSSLIQIAKNKATSAELNSKTTLATAEEGKETVLEVVSRMNNIKAKTLETEELITGLNKYTKEITLITETISQIANQTNLLALNAAIEAARAGEAGKGFAVVADEVRKLAEQSNKSAAEVAEIILKVIESTKATVAATNQSRTEVDEGVAVVSKAGDALAKIMDAVQSTVENVSEIVNVTDEEVATSDKIVSLIDNLASFIENTAANAEQVSAATEETYASMQTIAASTEQLSAMAVELKSQVDNFKF